MASQVVGLVRSLLTDDLSSYGRRTAELDGAGWKEFGELVGAAFHQAVEHRYPAGRADGVGALVDEARRPYLGSSVDVDREAAAVLVRSALGDDAGVARLLAAFDEPELARIELVLTRRLLLEAGLTGALLEEFLAGAQSAASPWASAQPRPA
jgi:hypothetical protein